MGALLHPSSMLEYRKKKNIDAFIKYLNFTPLTLMVNFIILELLVYYTGHTCFKKVKLKD